ncbi:MAG TPA: FAD-dependent thymidylate synthase [Bryobacteraceae bacterium]|nr:FAD-dependent thymidylate synthase [Bryobacteraceae bacterium]
MPSTPHRVLTLAPMPPEKCAYALARYSRSPDSIRESIEWVRTHDSHKFLEHFYFQYGHASIADLGHTVLCFEGISELAATAIEDEPLWDGQAKSSRYQDYSRSGFIAPADLSAADEEAYKGAGARLIAAYLRTHAAMVPHLSARLPRPADMKPDAYGRNIAARAFDVARYLLFLGVGTNVGQVASIRTLEKQIRRFKASEHEELRSLADEIAAACARPPDCIWDAAAAAEPLSPTLARHTDPDQHINQAREDLRAWAAGNLPPAGPCESRTVDLLRPAEAGAEAVATLLYTVTDRSFRELYERACGWSEALRREVMDTALRSRTRRDELLREFRGGPYVFDIVMDVGAYRDLHRHRRCQQYRQSYTSNLGYETPDAIAAASLEADYRAAMEDALAVRSTLPAPQADYLTPFGARSRFLFKMDFAEADYICRLRSGVKGHFSYRRIAWEMKEALARLEPELAPYLDATPPTLEDPLKR